MPDAVAIKGLRKPEALRLIAKSIVKAGAKNIAISVAVLGPGVVLALNQDTAVLGIAWLFVGSFGMMAWTYRRPWRLGFVSCLIPPLAAAACYVLQLVLFADAAPPPLLLLVATGVGVAVGYMRSQSHEVFEKDGSWFAQRTVSYLAIWVLAYFVTQIFGMAARNYYLVAGGLITGAFSTVMLAFVSLMLLRRFRSLRQQSFGLIALPLAATISIALLAISPGTVNAAAPFQSAADCVAAGGQVARSSSGSTCIIRNLRSLCAKRGGHISSDFKRCLKADEKGRLRPITIDPNDAVRIPIKERSVFGGKKIIPDEAGRAARNLRDKIDQTIGKLGSGLTDRVRQADTFDPPSLDDAAAVSAVIATILIAAGIAVNLAQAIAAAIANAIQAGVEVTANDIGAAIVQGKLGIAPDIGKGKDPEPPDKRSKTGKIGKTKAVAANADQESQEEAAPPEKRDRARKKPPSRKIRAESKLDPDKAHKPKAKQPDHDVDSDRKRTTVRHKPAKPKVQQELPQSPEPARDGAAAVDSRSGFAGHIWNRLGEGLSGIRAEVTEAAEDVYNDPRILLDTARNIEQEIDETGAVIQESAGELADGLGRAAQDIWRAPATILVETMSGSLQDIGSGVEKVATGAWDAGTGLWQAAKDTHDNPELFGDTLLGMKEDADWAADKVKETVTDPDKVFNGVKMLSGAENFENALDEKRSLPGRIGQVGLGVVGLYGTVTGARGVAETLKGGATKLIGKVGGGSGLLDEAAQLAAAGSDDVARLGAGPTDDAARLAAGSSDETAALAGQTSDDGTRLAGQQASQESASLGGSASEKQSIDELRTQLRTQKRGPVVSPDDARPNQDYANHLKDRKTNPSSTIQPGNADDFAPAQGVTPDTSGYARVSEKNIQMVADKHGVQIHTRPTSPYARELLENGEALPKPELLKNKSISDLDTLIGADTTELGKVGHFQPKRPPDVGARLPNGDEMTESLHKAAMDRFTTRADEFRDQAKWLKKHGDKVEIRGNLIIDKKTGLPFTGDVDGFAIRGMHGETLPKAVLDQIQKELIQGPGHVKHGFHKNWNYSQLSRQAQAGGAQSKFAIAQNIDRKILGGHAPVAGDKPGEALVSYAGREATRPGMAPNPKASWWMGGLDNPQVLQKHIQPVAEKYGALISKGKTGFEITGSMGQKLPDAVVEQIKKELAHLL